MSEIRTHKIRNLTRAGMIEGAYNDDLGLIAMNILIAKHFLRRFTIGVRVDRAEMVSFCDWLLSFGHDPIHFA